MDEKMIGPAKILTVKDFYESKFKQKGSIFIGQVYPVVQEKQAEEILESVRKKYHDATHHCYAYRVYAKEEKYSDDGEPSGTAGVRILNAIHHFDLYNVLVISIRYFGGVKLGVGPLGKAYYQSALQTLEQAKKIEKFMQNKLKIIFDYSLSGKVHNLLNLHNAKIMQTLFEDKPAILFLIEPGRQGQFAKAVKELSKGSACLEVLEERLLF